MATKADIIRQYLARFPELGPNTLVETIKKDFPEIKLRAQEVSTIKSNLKKAGLWPPAGTSDLLPTQTGEEPSLQEKPIIALPAAEGGLADKLRALKEAAEALGGPKEAKKLLDLLK